MLLILIFLFFIVLSYWLIRIFFVLCFGIIDYNFENEKLIKFIFYVLIVWMFGLIFLLIN